jgi:hypothetical protein
MQNAQLSTESVRLSGKHRQSGCTIALPNNGAAKVYAKRTGNVNNDGGMGFVCLTKDWLRNLLK